MNIHLSKLNEGCSSNHLCELYIVPVSIYVVLYIFLLLRSIFSFFIWISKGRMIYNFFGHVGVFLVWCFYYFYYFHYFNEIDLYFQKISDCKNSYLLPIFLQFADSPKKLRILSHYIESFSGLYLECPWFLCNFCRYSNKTLYITLQKLSLQFAIDEVNIYATISIGSSYSWAVYNKLTLLM